jgi:hypothetical protein
MEALVDCRIAGTAKDAAGRQSHEARTRELQPLEIDGMGREGAEQGAKGKKESYAPEGHHGHSGFLLVSGSCHAVEIPTSPDAPL